MAVSIVDYIKSKGGDSSYAARKKLAEQQGISNYRGSAGQNTELLRKIQQMQTGKNMAVSQAGKALVQPRVSPSPAVTLGVSPGGAVASEKRTITRGYQPTEDVTRSRARMEAFTEALPDDYEESKYAKAYRKKLGEIEASKPEDFKSKYSAQIGDLLNRIYNEKDFSYTGKDMQKDDLYKLYAQQYQQNAERAMRDTIGAATAMSGGYGSSYASQVGQQAYDQRMAGLNDKAMEFYDKAYERYLNDRSNRYNQLNTFNNQDSIDYGRYRDTVGDWKDDRAYYANALNNERNYDLNVYNADNANYWNSANFLAGRYDADRSADMSAYQQDEASSQWAKQYELSKAAAEREAAAAELDNQLKRLQIQNAQQALAMRTSGGGSGRGGSGRGGGSSKTDDRSWDWEIDGENKLKRKKWISPMRTVEGLAMAREEYGEEGARDYANQLRKEYEFGPETPLQRAAMLRKGKERGAKR